LRSGLGQATYTWAQQVSNLRYRNPTVNKSFKFHIFYDHKFTRLKAFTTK